MMNGKGQRHHQEALIHHFHFFYGNSCLRIKMGRQTFTQARKMAKIYTCSTGNYSQEENCCHG